MNEPPARAKSSPSDLLSKVSRYEALFELASVINAAADIASVGEVLANRLKYIVDVYTWRYFCVAGGLDDPDNPDPVTIVIDGFRGKADVVNTTPSGLSEFEIGLWRDSKTRILCGNELAVAQSNLPDPFSKDDVEQIAVNTLVVNGQMQALYFFGRRRQPFTELDVKCLTMVTGFFHRKVHMLWDQQRLRRTGKGLSRPGADAAAE